MFRHLIGIANIRAFPGLPTSPSKGTKVCPDTPVIKLHALTLYVVSSEQILFNSFSEVSRCYTLRAKNINSVSEEKILYKLSPLIVYVVFHSSYLNMAVLFSYAELKSQCQYYQKSLWLRLGHSQTVVTHLNKKKLSVFTFFLFSSYTLTC